MHSETLDLITDRLKNEPQETLDLVLSYLDEIISKDDEAKAANFELTEADKQNLIEIKNRPLEQHTDADAFVEDMKLKYGF